MSDVETPAGYETWTADRKHAWLWETLVLGSAYQPPLLPPLASLAPGAVLRDRPVATILVVARRKELGKALSRTSDLMEPGRPKVIHRRGTVAMIEFETAATSSYTGLLAAPLAGGASGLIRLSLVARPEGDAAVTPALGLKLLIDGGESADLVAMNRTIGQGRDFDMFSNTMTNDLSEEHEELRRPQRAMKKLFLRVSRNPRRLVVDHLAAQHRDGSRVTEPKVPRRLVFHPTIEAKRIFAGQAGVDFRRVLAAVPVGTPLYDVEAVVGAPVTGEGEPVGVIRTTTPFVASEGGDRLFFRHVQDPADLKLKRVRS